MSMQTTEICDHRYPDVMEKLSRRESSIMSNHLRFLLEVDTTIIQVSTTYAKYQTDSKTGHYRQCLSNVLYYLVIGNTLPSNWHCGLEIYPNVTIDRIEEGFSLKFDSLVSLRWFLNNHRVKSLTCKTLVYDLDGKVEEIK